MYAQSHPRIRPLVATAMLLLIGAGCTDAPSPTELDPNAEYAALNGKSGMQQLDIAYIDSWSCSFPFDVRLTGAIKTASMRQKKDGTFRVVEILANGRIELDAGARVLHSALGGTAIYTLDPQLNVVTVAWVGLNGAFTVPGHGLIALETGRLVVDGAGNIVWEKGPHDVFGANPKFEPVCDMLQP